MAIEHKEIYTLYWCSPKDAKCRDGSQLSGWPDVILCDACLSLPCVYSGLVNNADLAKEKLYTNLTTWISSHEGWPGYHHYWSWWLHSRDKSWAPDTPPHSVVTRHLGASCLYRMTGKQGKKVFHHFKSYLF